jgi:hypothetical protein
MLTRCWSLGEFCRDRNAASELEKKAERPTETKIKIMFAVWPSTGAGVAEHLYYINALD